MLFGIVERGFVREGYFADLVAVDLSASTRVDAAQVRYKCGWSPLEGMEFHSRVALTVLNGAVVFRDGRPSRGRAWRARSNSGRVVTRTLPTASVCFSRAGKRSEHSHDRCLFASRRRRRRGLQEPATSRRADPAPRSGDGRRA